MSWATAIFLIVLIWGAVTMWTRRHDRELGVTRDEDGNPVFSPQSKADTSAQEIEITELKERIAVLERIATDNNSADARERERISSEIEALRAQDEPSLPADPTTPKSNSTPTSTDA